MLVDNLYWLPELLGCVYFKNTFIIDMDIATAISHQPCLIPSPSKDSSFRSAKTWNNSEQIWFT